MDKSAIINFFGRLAPDWDRDTVHDDRIIGAILDAGGITAGVRVLDAACGTGVLFPDYRARGAIVTAADISPKMAEIAAQKAVGTGIEVLCADVAEYVPETPFDRIMLYNAFPHFPDPHGLITHFAEILAAGGRATVAHGASREAIDAHHSGAAKSVSMGLMPADELAALMGSYFRVDVTVSDGEKYIVSGVKL